MADGQERVAANEQTLPGAWRYLCYVWRTDRLARAAMVLLVSWLLLLVALIAR